MMSRLILLVCLAASCRSAEQWVTIYGPRPIDPQLGSGSVLLTAHVDLVAITGAANVPSGSILRASFAPQKDSNGIVTGRYKVLSLVHEHDGTTQSLGTWTTANAKVIAPDASSLGEVYWYSQDYSQIRVVRMKTGTVFASQTELVNFRLDALDAGPSVYRRLKATVDDSGIRAGSLTLAVDNQVFPLSVESIPGAWIVVYDTTGARYHLQERDLVYATPTEDDPYLQDGTLIQRQPVLIDPEGWLRIGYDRGDGVLLAARARPSADHGVGAMPPSLVAEIQPYGGTEAVPIVTHTDAPDRDQEVQLLFNDADAARSITSSDELQDFEVAMGGTGVFTAEGGRLGVANNGDFSEGTGVASLDAELQALPDRQTLMNRMQVQTNSELNQSAPQLVDPAADPAAQEQAAGLQAEIVAVEAYMARQHPNTGPLRQPEGYRKAKLYAAGIRPFYQQGEKAPGDGDNPRDPLPGEAEGVGAPAYDMDGDHDLDRFNTSDPWDNGYKQLEVRWNITQNDFKFSSYNGMNAKFAVFGVTGKGDRAFLFAGRDGLIFASRKAKWTGTNYHSYAIRSLLDPLPQANVYRFGLRYKGKTEVEDSEDTEPQARVVEASGTITHELSNGIDMVSGPREVWAETAYLYEDLVQLGYMTPQDVAEGAYSEPDFVPRTFQGKPLGGAKIVRSSTFYTWQNGQFLAGQPVVQVVYFPAEFRPEEMEHEEVPPLGKVDNAFEWDYHKLGDGMPWNYRRGDKFPRGFRGVALNESKVLQFYGSDLPAITVPGILVSRDQTISFVVRERPEEDPPFIGNMTEAERDAAVDEWTRGRAMYHNPYDGRTDMNPGQSWTNRVGKRLYDIVQGVGYYLFKGQRHDFTSGQQQAELLAKMWSYFTWTPPTVFQVLHIDNDPGKPLLNTARGRTLADGSNLVSVGNGQVWNEVAAGGDDMNANVRRRKQLIDQQIFIFSAARGREWEVEFARKTPRTTKLYCVEFESPDQVAQLFSGSGRDVTLINNDGFERHFLGELNERVFGKINYVARLKGGGASAEGRGDGGVLGGLGSQQGNYVFAQEDIIYDRPGCLLTGVALLDDRQYGDPRTDQWYGKWLLEYRHPMVIMYDDRTSALVVAYGENSNPEEWVSRWDQYAPPSVGEGLGYDPRLREAFEAWTDHAKLAMIYDHLNADRYGEASRGDLTLPAAPAEVPLPVKPKPTAEQWQGGDLTPPVVVDDPGARPEPPPEPLAPWTCYGTYDGLSETAAIAKWEDEAVCIDSRKPGMAMLFATNRVVNGNTPLSNDPVWKPMINGCSAFWDEPDSIRGGEFITAVQTRVLWRAHFAGFVYINPQPASTLTFAWSLDDCGGLRVNGTSKLRWPSSAHNNSGAFNVVTGWNTILCSHGNNGGGAAYGYFYGGQDIIAGLLARGGEIYPLVPVHFRDDVVAQWRTQVADHQEELAAFPQVLTRWEQETARFEQYQNELLAYRARLAEYQHWLEQQAANQIDYQKALVRYEEDLARYNAYLVAKAAWDESVAELLPLKQAWEAYVKDRDNWCFQVEAVIGEPGVAWPSGEPVFQAYDWWFTQVHS